MDMTSVFAPITKSTEQDDGTLLVYGKVSDDGLDLDGQRCDKSWLSEAVPAWFGTGTGVGGNIRAQHRADSAIGKAIEHEANEDGHYITARIVDRDAIVKTRAGVYTGFSVGIKNPVVVKSPSAPNGLLAGGSVVEVSLVDRPANPSCLITLCKAATPGMEINAADFDEDRGLVRCEDVIDKAAEPEETGMTVTLADTLPAEQIEKLAAAVEPAELPATPDEPIVAEPVEKTADAEPVAEDAGTSGNAPTLDVDAAKALVTETLAKAEGDDMGDTATFTPPSDEELAALAISIIARLIQSEAGDMVSNPGEDDDIRCLLSAIGSLRWYRRRERQEGDIGGVSDSAPYEYAATPDTEKAVELVNVNPDPSPETVAAFDKAAEKAKALAAPVEANELGDLAPAGAVTRIKSVSADDAKSIAKATVDNAFDELAGSLSRQRGTDDPAPVEKAVTPETTKATTVEPEDTAALVLKALSADLSKADSPLRSAFQALVTDSTKTIAEALDDTRARLVKVEGMAVPGGPALRRTEVERTSARKNDLAIEAARLRSLEANTHDQTLVKGYRLQADALEAEIRAISV